MGWWARFKAWLKARAIRKLQGAVAKATEKLQERLYKE